MGQRPVQLPTKATYNRRCLVDIHWVALPRHQHEELHDKSDGDNSNVPDLCKPCYEIYQRILAIARLVVHHNAQCLRKSVSVNKGIKQCLKAAYFAATQKVLNLVGRRGSANDVVLDIFLHPGTQRFAVVHWEVNLFELFVVNNLDRVHGAFKSR